METTLILTLLKRAPNAILSHRLWKGGTAPAPDILLLQNLQKLILLVSFVPAICTVLGISQADAAPSLPGVKSTDQNRDSYIFCKTHKTFLLSFEAVFLLSFIPSFLPSISALSPCASLSVVQPTAFSHQKLTFPIIKVLARFPIFFTLFPPTLFRKENVNEQELKAIHKPGEFVSDGQRDRGRWENVNSYISKKWHVLAFAD